MVIFAADLVGSATISMHLVNRFIATTIQVDLSGTGGFRSIIKSRHQSLKDEAPLLVKKDTGDMSISLGLSSMGGIY